jgi:hypothetical protein
MGDFAGRWITTWGPMDLTQDGDGVRGTYLYQGQPCDVDGKMEGARLVFRYQDSSGAGDGWFELISHGQFRGQYRLDGTEHWLPWTGQRGWDAIWDTSFGRMRLIQEQGRVHGFYDGAVPGTIEGKVENHRLVFRYQEPTIGGRGWFELSDDELRFHGEWQPDGSDKPGQWTGQRVLARVGVTWLVVIEAHWQHSLADRDFSYGGMLKEIFARLPNVAVRQRFFNDEASLARWCREVVYFPEPAVVLIASHGTPEGVTVHGRTINTRFVIDSLRHAQNVQLLHFSTCLVMKEDNAGDFAKRIEVGAPFPISGYTTAVDWGGSAVVEFSYLDLILGKHKSPEQAAALLPKLVAYAGDEAPEGCPYSPAGFRFFKA